MPRLARVYRSGEKIPASGIYRVLHQSHRLPDEVTLLKGADFPRCSRCQDEVCFMVVRIVAGDLRGSHPIILHELPVLPDAA